MNERLLELVSSFKEIYDPGHSRYKDHIAKEEIWTDIALELNKTPLECKQRWTSLRDQYRKTLRKMKKEGDDGEDDDIPRWKYVKLMSFLKPYLREKDTLANWDDEYIRPEEIKTENARKRKWDEEILPEKNITLQATKNNDIGSKFRRTSPPPSLKQPKTAEGQSFVFLKPYSDNPETRMPQKSADPIDLFFDSISVTVKSFTPYYQNLCKTKIFSIVSELEMQQILGQTPQAGQSTTTSMTAANLVPEISLKEGSSDASLSPSSSPLHHSS